VTVYARGLLLLGFKDAIFGVEAKGAQADLELVLFDGGNLFVLEFYHFV
jgi:hypothetical protein